MRKFLFASIAAVAAVTFVGCEESVMDQQADQVRENTEATADAIEENSQNAADSMREAHGDDTLTGAAENPAVEGAADAIEEAGQGKADAVRAAGEGKADALEASDN